MGVHGLRILRIENKEVHDAAKVEHPPGLPAVMSDVGAGHIAGEQHGIRIVRTDCWIKHRAAATGTDHAKISRPLCPCAGHAENKNDADGYSEFHGFSGLKRLPGRFSLVMDSRSADNWFSLESDPKPQPDRATAIDALLWKGRERTSKVRIGINVFDSRH